MRAQLFALFVGGLCSWIALAERESISAPTFAAPVSTDAPLSSTPNKGGSEWSFRLTGGASHKEGLLQVLPPHETEWGTVCGDSSRMILLLRSGASESQALAGFFSPANARAACKAVGAENSAARAFRLSQEDGWGSGPVYMSNVDCASQPTASSLDECFHTLFLSSVLQKECTRSDDVYLRCGEEVNAAAAVRDDMEDAVQHDSHKKIARQLDVLSLEGIPSFVVVVTSATTTSELSLCISGVAETTPRLSILHNDSQFVYTNVSFDSTTTGGGTAGSDTGDETAAPGTVTPGSQFMAKFLSATSYNLFSQCRIIELRTDAEQEYGSLTAASGGALKSTKFSLGALSLGDFLGNGSFTHTGYVFATVAANSNLGGSICNVPATLAQRVTAASHVCYHMGQPNTVPSLLIPNFGSGFGRMIQLSEVYLEGNSFGSNVSTYYNKINNCNAGQTVGVICGAGEFAAAGYNSYFSFCADTSLSFQAFRQQLYQKYLIAPYRVVQVSSNPGTLCFRAQYGYAFKDNTSNEDFDVFDMQFIFASMNANAWGGLGFRSAPTMTPYSLPPYIPVLPVVMSLHSYCNITGAMIRDRLIAELHLDPEDVVVLRDNASCVIPTPAPPPTKPRNRKNKTRSKSLLVTETHWITKTATVSQTLAVTPTYAEEQPPSTAQPTSPPHSSSGGSDESPTDAPPDVSTPAPPPAVKLCTSNYRMVTIQVMFQAPGEQAYQWISSNSEKVYANLVCSDGSPLQYITPPPPPPDMRPLIAGLAMASLVFLVLAIAAIIVIKRVYYTRTSKRWDDDYVMMNMQVLTVPLATVEMETPKRRNVSKSKKVFEKEDEDDENENEIF